MPRENARRRTLLVFVLSVIVCFTMLHGNRAYGQLTAGTINGIVTDSTGSAIVGASISIMNTATQVVTPAKTKSDGSFEVGGLVLGPYQVTFEAPGFKKIVDTNIRIEAASIVKLDETMAPGAVTATVEVNAQGAALETETIANDTTLEQELVQNEPVVPASGAFRDSILLVNLTPGVTGNFVGVYIAGGRGFADEVLLDGVPELFAPLNTTGVLVASAPMDDVSQVYVQPGVPAAEYGRVSGGVVTQLSRSGGSQYHGDAQGFFRNSIFDARAYNANSVGKDEQYEAPISFGGPVWIPHVYNGRKRTFFFFNYTRYWNHSLLATYGTIPTMPERTGDFSDQLAAGQIIYDPTTQVNGVRQPFNNNTFTPISAIMQQFLNAYPKPTNGALTNNILYFGPNGRVEAHWFYRIDHNITDNNSLHGTFSPGSSNYYQPTLLNNNIGYTTNQQASIWDDWTLKPSLLNHIVVSAIHYDATNHDYGASAYNYPNFPTINVPGTYPLGRFAGMPASFGFSGYFGFGVSLQPNSEWTYDYQDSVVWTKGKHSLKFGARFDAFQCNASNPTGLAGAFNFGSGETGLGPNQTLAGTGDNSAGNSIASALLGLVDNASAQDNVSQYGRSKYFAVYAQDSWRVTPKLTANYGIRWEMQTPIIDKEGHLSTLNPTLANSAAGGLPGAEIYAGTGAGRTGSNSFLSTWKDGYGPRLGLAYDLGHNMVVRAGYGLLYAPYELLAGWFNYPGYDQRGFSLDSSVASGDGGYTPAFFLDNGFPAANLVTSTNLSPSLYNGQSVTMWDTQNGKDNRLQDNQIWQLDVQKTFGSWYIDAGYVGQRGHHIYQANGGGPIFNQVNPKYLSAGSLLTDLITDPAVVAAGYTPPYPGFVAQWGTAATLAQALRPFPQYSTVSSMNYPSGSSSWDGFLLKVQKNYKSGFSLLAAYTWSKEFSNAGLSQFWLTNTTQDTYNSKGQKSLGEWDIPQNLQLSYIYELPFGIGKPFLNSGPLSYFAGGFGVSALQSYESGPPIRLYASAPALPLFNPQVFVDIVPGVKQQLASRSQTKKYNGLYDTTGTSHGTKWLNEAAFTNPGPYSFGNSRAFLDHQHQLATLNENLAFFKRTPIGGDGKRYIELRAEMFNAFNRANYGGLDTTLGDLHFGEYTGEFSNNDFGVQPGPKITEMELRIIF